MAIGYEPCARITKVLGGRETQELIKPPAVTSRSLIATTCGSRGRCLCTPKSFRITTTRPLLPVARLCFGVSQNLPASQKTSCLSRRSRIILPRLINGDGLVHRHL